MSNGYMATWLHGYMVHEMFSNCVSVKYFFT